MPLRFRCYGKDQVHCDVKCYKNYRLYSVNKKKIEKKSIILGGIYIDSCYIALSWTVSVSRSEA